MENGIAGFFKIHIREPLIYQISESLGESLESTSSAVDAVFPALVGALVIKGNTEQGANEILDFLRINNINDAVLHNLAATLSGGPEVETLKANGTVILKFLINDKVIPLIDTVALRHGLRTSSAGTLLKIVSTLMMISLARLIMEKKLDASGLNEFLLSHLSFIKENTPPAFADLIGPGSSVFTGRTAHGIVDVPNMDPPDNRTTFSKLLPWIILLIASLGLFYLLDRGTELPPPDLNQENRDSIMNMPPMDTLSE